MDTEKILEALKMQPLSEEEKSSRHILGRLYGPIATSKESTRNGRKYNEELWKNALNDEIFREKVANKSLFLELGHPTDREETDMTKVCACIPELPKIINGDLYAYVDILDTANGRLLKTLCDYGFTPGISSRGSGDIMSNDEVDPDTFVLETWDIVQLPAVKKARMTVCESVDQKANNMKKALTESFDVASEKDKTIMKEALDKLNISIEEPVVEDKIISKEMSGGIDYDAGDNTDILVEKTDAEEVDAVEPANDQSKEDKAAEVTNEKDDVCSAEEASTEIAKDGEDGDEKDEVEREESQESSETSAKIIGTVDDMIDALSNYDKSYEIEVSPVTLGDSTYKVDGIEFNEEDSKVIINMTIDQTGVEDEDDRVELPEDEDPEVNIEIDDANSDEEELRTDEDNSELAEDNGDDEIIESLKEAIQQKDLLEKEVKNLKESKTVSDAEVKRLSEELNKYKYAFFKTSEVAATAKKFENDVKSLKESLSNKDLEIAKLKQSVSYSTELNESIAKNANKVEQLTAKLNETEKELTNKSDALNIANKRVNESLELAKEYKKKFTAVLNKYVESKAKMLGVRPSDIITRLDENYTITDIDNVCDRILTESVGNFKPTLPFASKKIEIKSSAADSANALKNGYDIDDDLLELAGLR